MIEKRGYLVASLSTLAGVKTLVHTPTMASRFEDPAGQDSSSCYCPPIKGWEGGSQYAAHTSELVRDVKGKYLVIGDAAGGKKC